ncbi:RasGEF domain-containing protein [Legionella sp. W05-934-2]|jgi:hypothetical protein|uniref:RasGEF domain-containing protein n=1 Tax=Legionella sp. W05-934-2 TaxID=1198649 RepID=UPI0034628B15
MKGHESVDKSDKLFKLKSLKDLNSSPDLRHVEKFRDNHPQLSARDTRGMTTESSNPTLFSGELSFLAKRPRKNSLLVTTPREGQIPIDKLILKGQLTTLINQLHLDLQEGKPCNLTTSQLELFYQYCETYSVLDTDELQRICEERPLTPFLYQQILGHLRQYQTTKQTVIEQEYETLFLKCLGWYDQCHIKSVPKEPAFVELSHSKAQQQRLEILWKLTTKQVQYVDKSDELGTVDFANALNGLCHTATPGKLIRALNKLIPLMNRRQIGIAQIIVLHLVHHRSHDFSDYAKNQFAHFCHKLNRRQQKLTKCDGYFGSEIETVFNLTQKFNQSMLTKNITSLEKSFQKSLQNSELLSFSQLFEQGINAHRKKNRHEIASGIATELINASSYYFQSIPMAEFFQAEDKREYINQFIRYINFFTTSHINTLLELNDTRFTAAVHLLVNVAKKLSYITKEGNFADINSLMMLNMIFGDARISKRIKNCSQVLSRDRKFIQELDKTLSCNNSFKDLKNMTNATNNHIPSIIVLLRSLQFGKDGNPDASLKAAVFGQEVEQVYQSKQRIAAKTLFFNTNIITEMSEKISWAILKPQPVTIEWEHKDDFETNLTKIESAIQKNQKPSIHQKRKTIDCEDIATFLWSEYQNQLDPDANDKPDNNKDLLQRLLKLTNTLYTRAQEPVQSATTLDYAEQSQAMPRQQRTSSFSKLSQFGSFLLFGSKEEHPSKSKEQTSSAPISPR